MFRFQLEIAIALAGGSLASATLLYLTTRTKDGAIQLPIHEDEGARGRDPLDVTTPQDLIEGYPIDEAAFWKRMRWRKAFLTVVLALATALNAVALGYAYADEREDVLVAGVQLVFSLYTLAVSAWSFTQADASNHSKAIIHLAVMTVTSSILLLSVAVLPESPPPVVEAAASHGALQSIWVALLVHYALAAVCAMIMPLGPPLHYPPEFIYSEKIVKAITNPDPENVVGILGSSCWDVLLFSYTTKVVWLGNLASSLEIGDLPIVDTRMRAAFNYSRMRNTLRELRPRVFKQGSGWYLLYKLCRLNIFGLCVAIGLAVVSACLFYAPAFFMRQLISYLEADPGRERIAWGLVYVLGLFGVTAFTYLVTAQLWSISTTTIQVRLRVQLNTVLFAKTLVRKDIASSAPPPGSAKAKDTKDDEDDFSSKAQIMTLMTTDVDRVSEFAWHLFSLVDSPIELVIGTFFLYHLLGVSSLFGLGVMILFLPLNHFAGKIFVGAQEGLMKARDERVALMNEILGGIRMLKFMAWERSFEKRVLAIREKELGFQKLHFKIETLWNAIWNGSPIVVTLIAFWHYAVIRQEALTPSIAFTSIIVFGELKFAMNALPETFINMLQCFVSLRRVEKYLDGAEVKPVAPLSEQSDTIALQSCTITWPQNSRINSSQCDSATPSTTATATTSTPRNKFILLDLTLTFPRGELSLICGKLGSGKTLLLMSLLGEADVLAGQLQCPRSPLDALASYAKALPAKEDWVVEGMCAYVPQAAWLRNASIKDNILFSLPYDEERYHKTLEVCALVSDMEILEDGDESEIGERGVNLSGGQKARVSLARAVYSRASILFLDDVLSAVDAHTAHHLYHQCLKGELMEGRTVILVSHHVQLCAAGAAYIVALDNGHAVYNGDYTGFVASGIIKKLGQTTEGQTKAEALDEPAEAILDSPKHDSGDGQTKNADDTGSSVAAPEKEKKPARKLIEEETRAVGRIHRDIWLTYLKACGSPRYWIVFGLIFGVASATPIMENGWLRKWSGSALEGDDGRTPLFYIGIYTAITSFGLVVGTFRWFILYSGSIQASTTLYKKLLETVLFADIRFHDTVSRGRLLNRFGKDFEGIDSSLSDNFGRTIVSALSAFTTIATISFVGGAPFIAITLVLGVLYYHAAKIYGQTSRDMRRLDSVSRSPLYSIYGETIAGVPVLRAFGASSKLLREMLCCVDTNSNPYYWMWGVNRWLSIRFNLLSAGIVGATGLACLVTPSINASMAGFALAFASTITGDLLFMVRRFVGLEQSMVALERVKEYSELQHEPAEFIEPRPPASWPSEGNIAVENLVIRYAPDLPDVLHDLNFTVRPGEKVGILGRTGSGKSTLALSFFRFVEPTQGRILVDGLDTSKIGLTDLRSRLTIIPQDPTILSGTLRSTLDVFDEYQDAEIYEALRRVHLIPSEEDTEIRETTNVNVFRDLDSSVSEGGENFSTGEKQLICMARAILKRSKVLIMDEATASVDYATDELIGKTIRHEFAESTILTIAHRLRTVIDYDRIMLLDQGKIVEFDRPATLLSDPNSKFYALCKATGKQEFAVLLKMSGVQTA